MNKRSTSVSLGPEMGALLHDLVQTGHYANASEVLRAGLRALETQTLRRQLAQSCGCAEAADRATLVAALRHIAQVVDTFTDAGGYGEELRTMAHELDSQGRARTLRRATK